MNPKLFITLFFVILFGWLEFTLSRIQDVSSKYLSLNQFSNSEVDYQIFHNLPVFCNTLEIILLLGFVYLTYKVWKPAKKQTKE